MSKGRKERRDRAMAGLPPVSRVPESCARFREVLSVGVGSWCPTPDGSGQAEAVALHFESDIGNFALRLKSPSAVDDLIAMLERHRNDVWPGAQ